MNDAITIALIGLAGSGVGSILGVLASAKLTNYRLEQLEQRVQAHNSLIERTYELEKHNEVQDERIRENDNRIRSLENQAKP